MLNFNRKRAGAKTSVALLSIVIFLLLLATPVMAATPGDVTENGAINVQDVVLVMQHILGIADPELTESQLLAADVNGDGEIDVQDVTLIMQKVLGLIDEFPLKNIVDTLIAADDFETLVEAVVEAGLVDDLKSDGPFTVFAPTDEAFADLLDDLDITVEELLNLDNLADILLYHVVAGSYSAEDVVAAAPIELETLQGDKISVTVDNDKVFVNDAEVVDADIFCSNGVIHAIDEVLLPPLDELEVVGLSVIDAKTIGVEFNRTPTDAEVAAVKFNVTKFTTNAVVTTVAAWDGNVAKLAREANLEYTPGTYVVEVKGIDTEFTGTVTITEPTATSLEIRATSLPDATEAAPLRVKLLDQYGAEMTLHPGEFNWTALNLTNSIPVTDRISWHPIANFIMNTDTEDPDDFKLGDEVQISFTHIPSSLNKTVVIPVTYKVQLATITFGDVILPTGVTQLTENLMNIKIPITSAKDQYGNDMFLVNGANVELLSSNQLIIEDSDLSFVTIDGVQHINIAEFQDKGTVTITVKGTPGVSGSKTITVLESVPYNLNTVVTPDSTIVAGKSTDVRFDVVDQFGNKLTSDQHPYEMMVVKTSGADVKISAPEHNYRYPISQAIMTIPITAGSPADFVYEDISLPTNETITFRLQKADNTFIDSEIFSFHIVADLDTLQVSVDKTEYIAGDDIEVTVKAMLDGAVHTQYNNISGTAKITIVDGNEDKFYNRTLTFENGVATATVPATLAFEQGNVLVEYDEREGTSGDFEVKAGDASKFLLNDDGANTLVVTQTDAFDNPIKTFEGEKTLIITYPTAATPIEEVSGEGEIDVTFDEGVGEIEFDLLAPGSYTVTKGDYTGSLTITP